MSVNVASGILATVHTVWMLSNATATITAAMPIRPVWIQKEAMSALVMTAIQETGHIATTSMNAWISQFVTATPHAPTRQELSLARAKVAFQELGFHARMSMNVVEIWWHVTKMRPVKIWWGLFRARVTSVLKETEQIAAVSGRIVGTSSRYTIKIK